MGGEKLQDSLSVSVRVGDQGTGMRSVRNDEQAGVLGSGGKNLFGHGERNIAVGVPVNQQKRQRALTDGLGGRDTPKVEVGQQAAPKIHEKDGGVRENFMFLEQSSANDLKGFGKSAIGDDTADGGDKRSVGGHHDRGGTHGNSKQRERQFLADFLGNKPAPTFDVVTFFEAETDIFSLAFSVGTLKGKKQMVALFMQNLSMQGKVSPRRGMVAVEEQDDALGSLFGRNPSPDQPQTVERTNRDRFGRHGVVPTSGVGQNRGQPRFSMLRGIGRVMTSADAGDTEATVSEQNEKQKDDGDDSEDNPKQHEKTSFWNGILTHGYYIISRRKKQEFLPFGKKIVHDLPEKYTRYGQKKERRAKMEREYVHLKRAADFFFAAILLFFLLFPMVLVGVAIRLTSPGRALFRQVRVGMDGKAFVCYKFRTMVCEAPSNCPTSELHDAGRWVTPIGRFLRKTSLDELPQLWNVLRGDMSLVGPRPLIPQERVVHELRHRYGADRLRPGMTGLAQIRGRDFLDDRIKAAWDARYGYHLSLGEDLRILAGTVGHVLGASGVKE